MRSVLPLLVCVSLVLSAAANAVTGLVVGVHDDVETMDPGAHRGRVTESILRNIYDGLATLDADMALQTQLAESWLRLDPKTYEVRLREGVRFHNGTPLLADDVVFTFSRLIEQGAIEGRTSPRKSLLGPLLRVEAVDELTVRFVLAEPWPVFLQMLPFQQVVSREFIAALESDQRALQANGTGPFKLSRWIPERAVILERFGGYYGGSPALPPVRTACLDRVVFQVIPHNESRVAGLLAGDFDIVGRVPPHAAPIIDSNPDLRTLEVNGTRSYFLAPNLRTPPFSDQRVRRAVAHAIDRNAITDQQLLGRATTIDGILSPDAFGKNESLPSNDHDLVTATALLRAAGFGKGFRVLLHTYPNLQDIGKAIALQLAALNIDVELALVDPAAMRERWLQGAPPAGAMLLTSWGNGSLDPVGIFTPTHHSEGRGNSSGYSNPELDDLLERAAVELDRDQRAGLYRQAEAMASRDLAYIYLWVTREIYGLTNRVTGWRPRPDGRINLHDVCLSER